MLADPYEGCEQTASAPDHSTAITLYLYVEDVDSCFAQALAAGAQEAMAVQNMFYCDRNNPLLDPYVFVCKLATHVEDVAPDELQRRAEQMFSQGAEGGS